jgi:hypothetical protein
MMLLLRFYYHKVAKMGQNDTPNRTISRDLAQSPTCTTPHETYTMDLPSPPNPHTTLKTSLQYSHLPWFTKHPRNPLKPGALGHSH